MRKVYEVTVKLLVVSDHGQGNPAHWELEHLVMEAIELESTAVELVPAATKPNNQTTQEKPVC